MTEPRPGTTGDGSGGTAPGVLLVDDDAVSQRVVRLMVERLGCRVDVAANGRDAVALASLDGCLRRIEVALAPWRRRA